jgi:hypothetical protein
MLLAYTKTSGHRRSESESNRRKYLYEIYFFTFYFVRYSGAHRFEA